MAGRGGSLPAFFLPLQRLIKGNGWLLWLTKFDGIQRLCRESYRLFFIIIVRTAAASIFGHEMSPEHWQWKYGDGRGEAIGVWEDGALIAHYGGVARRIVALCAGALERRGGRPGD